MAVDFLDCFWDCWMGVTVRVTIAVNKNHDQKHIGEERVSIPTVLHRRKAGQEEFKTGADVEAMQQCCLLASSTWLAQPAFFEHPELPAQARLYRSHINLELRKCPLGLPTSLRHFLNGGPLLSDDSGWCQFGRKPARTCG